ncbi:MAG: hypothetical protein KDK66_08635 [Deltaproteobacteria bacterium]|nr:hypothetical protein [Deltaproteobacteria bacterium]
MAKTVLTFLASEIRGEPNLAFAKGEVHVASLGSQKEPYEAYHVIFKRNIFDSQEPDKVVVQETPEKKTFDPNAEPVKTDLPIQLISTVVVGNGKDKRSSATIATKGREEEIYTVGEEKTFHPGVKLTQILPDRIIFINDARLEYAEIEGFGNTLSTSAPDRRPFSSPQNPQRGAPANGVNQVSEDKYVIERSEVDRALSDMTKLFTQIRVQPQFKNGKPAGLKLQSVASNSLFAKLGLRRNDVLEEINGQAVDFAKGMELFNQFRNTDQFSISLLRGTEKKTLTYNIE